MKNIDIGSNWKLKLFHENIVSLSIFSAVVLLGAICVAFKGAQLCCGQKRGIIVNVAKDFFYLLSLNNFAFFSEKQFCKTDQGVSKQ